MTRINNNTPPQDRDENPGKAGDGKYGIVNTRILLDIDHDPPARLLIYNPGTGKWDEIEPPEWADEVANYLEDHGHRVGVGVFNPGFITIYAMPREEIPEWLMPYVVEWIDELPPKPFLVNEGVELRKYRTKDGSIIIARPLNEERGKE